MGVTDARDRKLDAYYMPVSDADLQHHRGRPGAGGLRPGRNRLLPPGRRNGDPGHRGGAGPPAAGRGHRHHASRRRPQRRRPPGGLPPERRPGGGPSPSPPRTATATKTYTVTVLRGTGPYGWKAGDDINTLAAAGNTTPYGIWSNGETMWVVDFANPKLYAYDLATGDRVPSRGFDTLFDAGNVNPTGLWSDGETIWVADINDDKLYAYDLETGDRVPGEDFDTLAAAGNTSPTGIWSDGETMWVADSSDAKLYAYDLESKERVPEQGFDILDLIVAIPFGIWSDGVTMWVAAEADAKLYAYDLEIKARVPGRDFDTLLDAGNRRPNGLWSDGAIMWVADSVDDKLYSYNMPVSDNADLRTITVDGEPVAGFDPAETAYSHRVDEEATQVTVAAEARQLLAEVTAITPSDADPNTGGHQVDFPLSDDQVAVTLAVTAQNGTATKTYTVTVLRGTGPPYGWKVEDDFNTLPAAGNYLPRGIWSDGETMWVSDEGNAKLYAYDLDTKRRVPGKDFDTLDAAGNNLPRGIWSDGETMWVTDQTIGADKLYAYDLDTKLPVPSRDFTPDAANRFPFGIWSDGVTLWVTDSRDDKLYAYDLDTKEHVPGRDFDTLIAAGNRDLFGIWSDGVTMWVSDDDDAKLYAYDLETKARLPGRDFDTLIAAGNSLPYDIWSDGETMWVTDASDRKLYSYNMPVSDNADLRSITVDGRALAGFDPAETAYSHRVDETATQVTVAAEARQLLAEVTAVTPSDADPSAAGHQVDFPENAREVAVTVTVTITVTAQDGSTSAYTVNLRRPGADHQSADESAPGLLTVGGPGLRPDREPRPLLGLRLVPRGAGRRQDLPVRPAGVAHRGRHAFRPLDQRNLRRRGGRGGLRRGGEAPVQGGLYDHHGPERKGRETRHPRRPGRRRGLQRAVVLHGPRRPGGQLPRLRFRRQSKRQLRHHGGRGAPRRHRRRRRQRGTHPGHHGGAPRRQRGTLPGQRGHGHRRDRDPRRHRLVRGPAGGGQDLQRRRSGRLARRRHPGTSVHRRHLRPGLQPHRRHRQR